MVVLLDYLGKPTRGGLVFQHPELDKGINDLLTLSAEEYLDELYLAVVREMKLRDKDFRELDPQHMGDVCAKRIPGPDEYVLRSQEFENILGESVVFLYDPQGKIVGAVVNKKPENGYHYTAGRSKTESPLVDIHFPEISPQAHNWETLFSEKYHGRGYSLLGLLFSLRLSQREGARYITAYTSVHAKNLTSTRLMEHFQKTLDVRLLAEFPMLDEMNREFNRGKLWAIDIQSEKTAQELSRLEGQLIYKFYN